MGNNIEPLCRFKNAAEASRKCVELGIGQEIPSLKQCYECVGKRNGKPCFIEDTSTDYSFKENLKQAREERKYSLTSAA